MTTNHNTKLYELQNAVIGEEVVIVKYDKNVDQYRYEFGVVEKFTKHTPAHVVISNNATNRSAHYQLDGYGIGDAPGHARRYLDGEVKADLLRKNVEANDKAAAKREAAQHAHDERRAKALAANSTTLRSMTWLQGAPGSIGVVNMVKENGERLTMFVTVEQRECIDWDAPRDAPDNVRIFTGYTLQVIGYGSGWYKNGFSTSMNNESRTIDDAILNLIVSEW